MVLKITAIIAVAVSVVGLSLTSVTTVAQEEADHVAVIDDAVAIGLSPDMLATLGVDGIEAMTVLDRVAARSEDIDQLFDLRRDLAEHKSSLRQAQAAARRADSADELATAEADIAAARAAIASTTTQIRTREATARAAIVQGVGESDWLGGMLGAQGPMALLPPEYRVLGLSDEQAVSLRGALSRERRAIANGESVDSETVTLLAGYRSDGDVAQALAWKDALTMGVQAAFTSYLNQP